MGRPRTFDEEEILDKALQLFWHKGYANTSVQDLVDQLGINRASLYNVFGDKEGLYNQAIRKYQQQGQQNVRKVFNDHMDVRAGLEALFLGSVAVHDEQPPGCMLVNCTVERAQEDPDLFSFLRKNKQAFIRIVKQYLRLGISSGQIPEDLDIDTAARYLFVFYSGLNVDEKLRPPKQEIRKIIRIALSFFEAPR